MPWFLTNHKNDPSFLGDGDREKSKEVGKQNKEREVQLTKLTSFLSTFLLLLLLLNSCQSGKKIWMFFPTDIFRCVSWNLHVSLSNGHLSGHILFDPAHPTPVLFYIIINILPLNVWSSPWNFPQFQFFLYHYVFVLSTKFFKGEPEHYPWLLPPW